MANWLSALSRTRKLFADTLSKLWKGGTPEGVTLDELEENLLRADVPLSLVGELMDHLKREARHGGAYLRYMKKAMNEHGDVASAAFAKIGVLMASARRTDKPLHPTNLHVNQSLFPNDTIQSRVPDPDWLERWLDGQIKFDGEWEKKVVDRILHNMSLLFEQKFETVQDLNRYRKQITARLAVAEPA